MKSCRERAVAPPHAVTEAQMAKQRVALVCVPLTLVGLYLLNIGSPSSQADARGGTRRQAARAGGGRAGGRQELMDAAVASLVASPPPAGACGDGRCEPPETRIIAWPTARA